MRLPRAPFPATVTFRLTLWYVISFALMAWLIFFLGGHYLQFYLHRQTTAEQKQDVDELASLWAQGDMHALAATFRQESQAAGVNRVVYALAAPDGKVLAASDLHAWGSFDLAGEARRVLADKERAVVTLQPPAAEDGWQFVFRRLGAGDVLITGVSLAQNRELVENYWRIFLRAVGALVVLGSLLGYGLTRHAMNGVERVTATAEQIGRGDLSRRVPEIGRGREIDHLAHAFNEMLERIQALVRELTQVTDNIAHDLRSPVTRMRGMAEATLQGAASPEDLREMAGVVVEESDRLVSMVNTMLAISEADAGVARFDRSPLDLGEIARGAFELFEPVAEDCGLDFRFAPPAAPVWTRGDRSSLQRVVANLVDNALKYTPAGGAVVLALNRDAGQAVLSVTDSGVGIAAPELEHIFERFYRIERSRSTPGNGLGLSLARAIVRAHAGEISVASEPGKGSTFTIRLPVFDPGSD